MPRSRWCCAKLSPPRDECRRRPIPYHDVAGHHEPDMPARELALNADRSGPAISVRGLSKRFGDRVAFDDVSFEIGYGEVFGFLGPNGAGKTTTVRTLGTLVAPTSGAATVAGIPLTPANGVEIRSRIAIMPESPGLYMRLTVIENLECFADLNDVPDAPARIAGALRAVGLADRTREVHELIDGLRKRGVTIFLTTHRLEEAERLCDRIAILKTTLRVTGRPDELRERLFAR